MMNKTFWVITRLENTSFDSWDSQWIDKNGEWTDWFDEAKHFNNPNEAEKWTNENLISKDFEIVEEN